MEEKLKQLYDKLKQRMRTECRDCFEYGEGFDDLFDGCGEIGGFCNNCELSIFLNKDLSLATADASENMGDLEVYYKLEYPRLDQQVWYDYEDFEKAIKELIEDPVDENQLTLPVTR